MSSKPELISQWVSYGGKQSVYSHASEACNCEMTFAAFEPPQAKDGPCPVLYYLSGLTCTHANVMEKGDYRRAAAEHGVIIVCPDTSPRGDQVPDEDVYFFGSGAGFYLDATEEPFSVNYRMASYIIDELPNVAASVCNMDSDRQSIFGHSMGGHGAITIALKNPGTYRSVSAFAPICAPSDTEWGSNAFSKYLGSNKAQWRDHDSVALIEDGHKMDALLVDQGTGDEFLDTGLRPHLLAAACEAAGIPLSLNMRDGYDHSYYFISTFMGDHIAWHVARLNG